jgi:hypothetical protein
MVCARNSMAIPAEISTSHSSMVSISPHLARWRPCQWFVTQPSSCSTYDYGACILDVAKYAHIRQVAPDKFDVRRWDESFAPVFLQ